MFREEQLDLVLVPLALAAVGGYHLWLLWAILRHPTRTVIGLNAIARKRWVAAMMAVGTMQCTSPSASSGSHSSLPCLAACIRWPAEHGEERRARGADAAEQHHGVDGAGDHGHHAGLRHQRLRRRHVSSLAVLQGAAAGVREQGRGGVRGQVPGRVALLHARLRLQRAGHPAVRARQLPPGRPAAGARRRRRRGGGAGARGGVRVLRGADGEPRQLRLVARPARLLRLPRALPLDVRTHTDAGLQRPHVRPALLPRHHQQRRPRPRARPARDCRRRRPKG